jgi:hypothetical protein
MSAARPLLRLLDSWATSVAIQRGEGPGRANARCVGGRVGIALAGWRRPSPGQALDAPQSTYERLWADSAFHFRRDVIGFAAEFDVTLKPNFAPMGSCRLWQKAFSEPADKILRFVSPVSWLSSANSARRGRRRKLPAIAGRVR